MFDRGDFLRNIIVVDCISSGTNYIEDIVNRGYNPVVLELQPGGADEDEYKQKIKSNYDVIKYDFDLIYEKDSYDETLEIVRKLNPLLVLAGNERGVILSSKLSNDLGLLGTPIENLDAMTFKDKMHERLCEAGLRYIRGKVVTSIEEAIEFYESESLKEVIIKPVYSFCSVGVRFCSNKNEIIDAMKELFNQKNAYGDDINELLVQERIDGEEYIVNTTSCDGVPRLISMWKYEKVKTSKGAIVYDSACSVNKLNIGEAELVEYAYDVVNAIGIEYGPVHGEYMIDENGPVLIEVNCRPCGLTMPAEYLDMIFSQHDTDSILDSYLSPENFEEQRKKPYRPSAYGCIKLFIVPEDIFAKSAPISNMSSNLKSHYSTVLQSIDGNELFVQTKDLNTSCGHVFLVHEDLAIVREDIEFLRSVEKNAFELILNEEADENYELDEDEIISKLQNIIRVSKKYGNCLLITDQDINDINVFQIGLSDIGNVHGAFDHVLVNLNKSLLDVRSEKRVEILINLFSYLKVGGIIFIPKSTYDYFPGGRKGIESLIKDLNLTIEAPPFGIKNTVIASKNSIQ